MGAGALPLSLRRHLQSHPSSLRAALCMRVVCAQPATPVDVDEIYTGRGGGRPRDGAGAALPRRAINRAVSNRIRDISSYLPGSHALAAGVSRGPTTALHLPSALPDRAGPCPVSPLRASRSRYGLADSRALGADPACNLSSAPSPGSRERVDAGPDERASSHERADTCKKRVCAVVKKKQSTHSVGPSVRLANAVRGEWRHLTTGHLF